MIKPQELVKLLVEKPKYLHKNKNTYVIISECKIKTEWDDKAPQWIDGIIYMNTEKPEHIYTREKVNFYRAFRLLD